MLHHAAAALRLARDIMSLLALVLGFMAAWLFSKVSEPKDRESGHNE